MNLRNAFAWTATVSGQCHATTRERTMGQIDDRQRGINDKLERLRKRVKETVTDKAVRATLLGLIDLLADEL